MLAYTNQDFIWKDFLIMTESSALPKSTLTILAAAGAQARESMSALEKASLNLVGECLKGQGEFYELSHYPQDDVYDADSHSQYYFHTHRGLQGEYGHFHTFLRAAGMPPSVVPVKNSGSEDWPSGADALSHLICISMSQDGEPMGLFTTNRWVTGETWYKADDVVKMIDAFIVDHAFPNLAVNQWISAMFRLFKYEIIELLHERDRAIAQWKAEHPDQDVFEDRNLEVTSYKSINVDRKIDEIQHALLRRPPEMKS